MRALSWFGGGRCSLQVSIKVAGEAGIEGTTAGLRGVWEATSFQLERLQCDPACVEQEASHTYADVFRFFTFNFIFLTC